MGSLLVACSLVWGQQAPLGVTLKSQITLATFSSAAGNDCWGYVSPSGNEYALMGLDNRMTVVRVTDPSNPVIIGTIPHGSSTWSDIKVYGSTAYVVTERSASGVQVVDLSDVDNGNVTLVRTITSPGRSHNLVMDDVNGFLYTVGSRDGTGTTMCFSLADPLDPVQVGANSMTTDYLHDATVVTYTTGPQAGKQIMYGFSEGRGVDVYDMTNKNAPQRIARVIYENMNYCHQGWLSDDLKYLYVDDELDESNMSIPTRSLIFDVSDPVNSVFIGTFSTGLNAIDHNQYYDDGFLFQANYRSGLRIFDAGSSPETPLPVGWYDTYTANNNSGFNGAWSTYPYFPSGNVIISDINRGLFVVDASVALTRTRQVESLTVLGGVVLSGDNDQLLTSNNQYLVMGYSTFTGRRPEPITFDVTLSTYDNSPHKISVDFEGKSTHAGTKGVAFGWNRTLNQWVEIKKVNLGTSDSSTVIDFVNNVSDYVDPVTKEVKIRFSFRSSVGNSVFQVSVDQLKFRVLR